MGSSGKLITTAEIVNGTILTADIGADQITSALILNGTITTADLAAVPKVMVTKTGNQSITENTLTPVTWDSEVVDNDTMHDNVTNNTRLTATTAGIYQVVLFAWFDVGTTGWRFAGIRHTDGTFRGQFRSPAVVSSYTEMCATAQVPLAVGEYVETLVMHTQTPAASSLNVLGGPTGCRFSMVRLGA